MNLPTSLRNGLVFPLGLALFLLILFGVGSCGLPNPVELNEFINPPYEFRASTSNRSITLFIRGHYDIDQTPFFNGFNVYYGETESYSDINRKLYTDERLPTIEAKPTQDGDVSIQFTFTFFQYKKDEDDETFETAELLLHKSYFFYIKPVNSSTGKEGSHFNLRIEARPCVKTYNQTASIDGSEVVVETISFSFEGGHVVPGDGQTMMPFGYRLGWAEINRAPEEQNTLFYSSSPQPLEVGHVYFIKQVDNYLMLTIEQISGSEVTYHYFYQEGSPLF